MEIIKDFLDINEYSNPNIPLNNIQGVVVHYVANPMSTAKNNRDYFNGLKVGKKNSYGKYIYASSHYIIGLQGEVIQCIPENKMAYATQNANDKTISIECCHEDLTGRFNDKTYASLIWLICDIFKRHNITSTDKVWRHYDYYNKACPLYYVKHEDAWIKLKQDVKKALSPIDEKLISSVNKLATDKIISSPESWNDVDKINPKLVDDLILKYVKSKLTYQDAIGILVRKGVVSNESTWLGENISKENCRDLIVKLGEFK